MADVFAYLEGFGTGGGEGGTLKVNAPPMVAVTITNKAGKTKTKTANADGMAIFKGLASGKWNVTIVNSDGKPTIHNRRCSDRVHRYNRFFLRYHQHHLSSWFDMYMYRWRHDAYSP